MAKWTISRIILTGLSSVGALFLLTLSLKMLFRWDFNLIFVSVVLIAIGIYDVIESHIRNYKTFKAGFGGGFKKNFHGAMNSLKLAIGLILVYMGVVILPAFNVLSITAISAFNGWILLVAALLTIADIFRWM